MLGFWIIVSHLGGAYLLSPKYLLHMTTGSTKAALLHAAIYLVPFVLFLPMSFPSIIAVFLLRFLITRFGVIDYILWARDRLAPQDKKRARFMELGHINYDRTDSVDVVNLHLLSIAVHLVLLAIIIITL